MLSHFKKTAVSLLFLLGGAAALWAQKSEDLRRDEAFFRKKIPEMRRWLASNGLENVFKIDSFSVSAEKVSIYLLPAFESGRMCDSLQCIWRHLEQANRDFSGKFFHERLLKKWAFLCEVGEEQAEVVVRCHPKPHFLAKMSGKNGKIPVEGWSLRSAAVMQVELPESTIQGVNSGENLVILPGKKVGKVCADAKQFFIDWYKTKGTPVLWNARIDTSFSFEDEFVVEVTHLSHEICPRGYYEYHRIYVHGIQQGENVKLQWEFQGKYGSGIFFPPRRNDYKDLSTHYKTDLENYQNKLFKRLFTYLSRR